MVLAIADVAKLADGLADEPTPTDALQSTEDAYNSGQWVAFFFYIACCYGIYRVVEHYRTKLPKRDEMHWV